MNLQDLEALARQRLSEKRFFHVMSVRSQAVKLAELYHADRYKAEAAALLHDITKETDSNEQLKSITDSGIINDTVILRSPQLYHAVTAYLFSRDVLAFREDDILNAVRYHTTARAGMSLLEKIIYIADATSCDREYKEAEEFRALSYQDLDGCLFEIIRHTLHYLLRDQCLIPEDTWNAYNGLCILRKG